MTSRRLFVLIEQLPETSAYWRARNTGDRWTETQHVLADIADNLRFMRREAQGDNSDWNPKPLPRPGEADQSQEQQEAMNAVHDGLLAMMTGAAPAD